MVNLNFYLCFCYFYKGTSNNSACGDWRGNFSSVYTKFRTHRTQFQRNCLKRSKLLKKLHFFVRPYVKKFCDEKESKGFFKEIKDFFDDGTNGKFALQIIPCKDSCDEFLEVPIKESSAENSDRALNDSPIFICRKTVFIGTYFY